jgi:CheY-like chemotaxis protein
MTSANAAAAGGRRIMIVEDNVDSADTMQVLLGLSGYDARTAYDGAAALKLAREFMPQVVLCDIGLPDKDGYQLARELRELPETRAAFLVALTGYGNAEDKRLATAAGFDAFQVKPVEPDALNALLVQHFSTG